MSDFQQETKDQVILRRAKDAVEACRLKEAEARRVLADAAEATKKAREKYAELFLAEEGREAACRRAAYNHATK